MFFVFCCAFVFVSSFVLIFCVWFAFVFVFLLCFSVVCCAFSLCLFTAFLYDFPEVFVFIVRLF